MSVIHWKNDLIDNFDNVGDWTGDASPSTVPEAVPFNANGGFGNVASTAGVDKSKSPKLTTLVSFMGADGSDPQSSLITDAAGDLFGTTTRGGANNDGTVFEIAKTKKGYASAPTTLVSFTGADGANPYYGSLFADAAGDLFGTTIQGGANNDGTVFEITKTKSGYASAPTTLVNFTGADGALPTSSTLIADAAGDLFGTTGLGGADNDGTVFEIVKTKEGYASAPTTLVSFTDADGEFPAAGLIADAAGDLFGTTLQGVQHGANRYGTVFEIAKTKHGFASAPTTLVSFMGPNGASPTGSLFADAAGNLFGTTTGYGNGSYGTVFEVTNSGFVPTTTLVTPADAGITLSSPTSAPFVQAMASHGASGFGEAKPTFLASQREMSTLLSRPQLA